MSNDDLVGREARALVGPYRGKRGEIISVRSTITPSGETVAYYVVRLAVGDRAFLPGEVYVGGRAAQVAQP